MPDIDYIWQNFRASTMDATTLTFKMHFETSSFGVSTAGSSRRCAFWMIFVLRKEFAEIFADLARGFDCLGNTDSVKLPCYTCFEHDLDINIIDIGFLPLAPSCLNCLISKTACPLVCRMRMSRDLEVLEMRLWFRSSPKRWHKKHLKVI